MVGGILGWTLTLLVAGTAQGLDPSKAPSQYRHDVWGLDEGLPQSSVMAILESRDGYLWLGTQEGLVRFDGLYFTVFDRQNTPQMRDQVVGALAEDDDGVIWAGTEDGLLRVDGGDITWVDHPEVAGKTVRVLFSQGQDLWVEAARQLYRLREGRFTAVAPFDEGGILDGAAIWSLSAAPGGGLWVATASGLALLEDGEISTLYTAADGLPGDRVYCVSRTRGGQFYAGTRRGLARWSEGRFEVLGGGEFPDAPIYDLMEDSHGNLWIGTNGLGLHRLDPSGRVQAFAGESGRSPRLIRVLHEDREGGLLIGTSGSGLHRLGDGTFTTWSLEEGMPGEKVYTVLEDRSGSLWVGTFGQGLFRVQGTLREHFTQADGLAHDLVWSLMEDRDGMLWVGTYGGGISRRLPDGRWQTLGAEQGLGDVFIRQLFEDSRGDVWVGTRRGLFRYRDGRFERIGEEHGVLDRGIQVFLDDREAGFWMGAHSGSLYRFVDGGVQRWGPEDGLDHGIPYALHQDTDGVLWIGTSKGLVRFDDGEIAFFDSRRGLRDNLVYTVLEDEDGYFWMGSNKGIYRVRRSRLNDLAAGRIPDGGGRMFHTADGMKSRETNGGAQPAAWKRRDGRLIFSTVKGFVEVDPTRVQRTPSIERAVIESVEVDERSLDLRQSNLAIAAGNERLTVRFAATNFYSPRDIHFRYRLEGYDHDWIDAGTERSAVYTRLPPGRYVMAVSARLSDGPWTEPARLALEQQPQFHQTVEFSGLVILLLGLSILGGHRLRVRQLEANRRSLRLAVDEALEQITILQGMLPICSSCKSIRDDRGYWNQLETYLAKHSEAELSHSLCPECATELYGDTGLLDDERFQALHDGSGVGSAG